MLTITFIPENGSFTSAAQDYSNIWALDGDRITAAIESAAQLTFKETAIEAIVFEGKSQSSPMKLRASYDNDTKKATIVHELLHRISFEYMLDLPVKGEDLSLGLHKQIYLLLYDIWVDLYGKQFADEQVEVESQRVSIYRAAWQWALGLSGSERKAKFRELSN